MGIDIDKEYDLVMNKLRKKQAYVPPQPAAPPGGGMMGGPMGGMMPPGMPPQGGPMPPQGGAMPPQGAPMPPMDPMMMGAQELPPELAGAMGGMPPEGPPPEEPKKKAKEKGSGSQDRIVGEMMRKISELEDAVEALTEKIEMLVSPVKEAAISDKDLKKEVVLADVIGTLIRK